MISKTTKGSFLYRFILFFTRVFFHLFYHIKVSGLEHFYPHGAILAPNHTSFFDPPLVAISWLQPVHFLAKASLFKNKIFGSLIRSLNAHPVVTHKGHAEVLKQTCALLESGHQIMIFPEGTRSISGELQLFKQGPAYLAYKSQTAIIPVYIQGAYEVWSRKRKFPKLRGKLHVVFGSPILANAFLQEDAKKGQEKLTLRLRESVEALKEWVEKGCEGIPP
ncbi:MAG: lysophospholipid acyltransferase family protein [Candidatus Rhabdochlamydia sp.]